MPAKKGAEKAKQAGGAPAGGRKAGAGKGAVVKGGRGGTKAAVKVKQVAKPTPPKDGRFEPRPRNFRIGGDIRHKTDLSRFVRWPRYVRVQRQRRILYRRLKVPPAIHQFSRTLDKSEADALFSLLGKYAPETKAEKAARVAAEAAEKKEKTEEAPKVVKFGLSHVTYLVEKKKARLVVIAHDVDPIELVVWLPALCRKMGVPYVIVKNKGRLGTVVHQKKAAAVALTVVRPEDEARFRTICDNARERFNAHVERTWGGGIMGVKTQVMLKRREEAIRKEAEKKALHL